MVFDIKQKVALITGGASGLGLHYAKDLLRNGAKGVVLADINSEVGADALLQINEEFGPNKAAFVLTDVTNFEQLEGAFKETINIFKNIDILINNAGILNDAVWERQIAINVNGTVHGILLAYKYLPKYKQGPEGLIVNISSTAGTEGYGHIPVYCATKFGVIGMTKSWGVPEFYDETGIRVVAICPGVTDTPLIRDASGRNLGGRHQEFLENNFNRWVSQKPDQLSREAMRVIKYAPNGTCWLIEGGEPAYEFVLPDHRREKKRLLTDL